MSKRQSYLIYFLLAAGLIIMLALPGCKEKNEDYPPKAWSSYFYQTDKITPRSISTILWENEHSRWFGSQSEDGLIYDDGYGWKIFTKQNTGVEHAGVNCLLRTPDNRLWEANRNGLHYYNGTQWGSLIKDKPILAIASEGIGNLWIVVADTNFPLAHYKNGELYYFAKSELPFTNINSICVDSLQNLWLSTQSGIYIYAQNSFQSFQIPEFQITYYISKAADSQIWASDGGFKLVSISGNSFNIFNTGTTSSIKNLLVLNDGSLWCTTQKGDLLCKSNSGWKIFTPEAQEFPAAQQLALAAGPEGYLLISYANGHVISFKYR